ncbi:MAG: lipid-binding SYLF domain-containing protein [Acidobacteriaceae bacterium]|nr:lipid-binding SYLF domain-containing protein [Acidobacteriaceae bacterium]
MAKRIILGLLAFSFLAGAEAPVQRLNSAADVLSEIMSTPDRGIPFDLMARAECVVVVPGLKAGAFGFGAKYGKGFFSCRKGSGWSAPASVRIEGGSFGFQIGGIESDLILLVMNRRGAQRLLASRFTLGGEGQVAAGPVGRSSTAQTDLTMRAEMLSWSRSRGVFAGVSLQGATLRQSVGDNEDIYARRLTNKQIIDENVSWPPQGGELHGILNRFSVRARNRADHRS